MSELYFLRHGERIDHSVDSTAVALSTAYQPYDPSISTHAISQIEQVVEDIASITTAFPATPIVQNKNVFIHFSPYLRCCQTADLLVTKLRAKFSQAYDKYNVKFQLLGDFALSEWIHDKMTNQPPFQDSDNAYAMYTANVKQLVNRNCCSNFRPASKLGHFNGPNLKHKDYQMNCKEYFTKLLATYDKSMYIKNQDIIIIVSHGYAINNFMSFFTNHPIFQEIPEAKLNVAKRTLSDGKEDGSYKVENYKWKLVKDAIDIMEPDTEYPLNLDSDVVYYKTNFIKRDKLKPSVSESDLPKDITSSDSNGLLCQAAKDWKPGNKIHKIKKEFQEKYIKDDAFKRNFNLTNPPTAAVTPEVSPQSGPSRDNSMIDLSKLDESLINPLKLKYGSSQDIPTLELNNKVNSRVNLLGYSGSNSGVSSTSSMDKTLQHKRNKSSLGSTEDSYFLQGKPPAENISKVPNKNPETFNTKTTTSSTSSDEEEEESNKRFFFLDFSPSRDPERQATPASYSSSPRKTRSRKNSIKFIPSGVSPEATVSMSKPAEKPSKVEPIFYYLDSNYNSGEDDDMSGDYDEPPSSSTSNSNGNGQKIFWLGQNK
ncbi:hypothetical protein JA1_002580 [Spathaspora sp. JA1]|nr:hypothetical protein JA1_002580 [Spathaspora sp. JA1]